MNFEKKIRPERVIQFGEGEDFDASPTLSGDPLTNELFDYIIKVAEGELTKNELNGYREISIFKGGVTL